MSNFTFEGMPSKLRLGDKVRIKVSPTPDSAVVMLYKVDDVTKERRGLVNIDILPNPDSPDTLGFNLPGRFHPARRRYKKGYYEISIMARNGAGTGNGERYKLRLD